MGVVAKSCGFIVLLAATSGAQAEPHFYYGPDCALENSLPAHVTGAPAGVVLEGKSGQVIAHDIACADRPEAFRALARAFHAPLGNEYVWSNAGGTNRGVIRITWEFRDHGVTCRDFALDHTIDGHRYLRQGTACLEADGNWHLH